MKVYLVRHAQSAEHEGQKRQSPNAVLGKNGLRQTELLAKRIIEEKENVDLIFSSKWERAKQTAENVARKLDQKVEYFEGIHEKHHSPSIYGLDVHGEAYCKYWEIIKKHASDLDWKYKGEGESLREVIQRAVNFKKHLLTHHLSQNILVFTHGIFIRCFITLCLLGDDYNDATFYKIFRSLSFQNTGITLLEYSPEKKHWEIIYLNDHRHLKE